MKTKLWKKMLVMLLVTIIYTLAMAVFCETRNMVKEMPDSQKAIAILIAAALISIVLSDLKIVWKILSTGNVPTAQVTTKNKK